MIRCLLEERGQEPRELAGNTRIYIYIYIYICVCVCVCVCVCCYNKCNRNLFSFIVAFLFPSYLYTFGHLFPVDLLVELKLEDY